MVNYSNHCFGLYVMLAALVQGNAILNFTLILLLCWFRTCCHCQPPCAADSIVALKHIEI